MGDQKPKNFTITALLNKIETIQGLNDKKAGEQNCNNFAKKEMILLYVKNPAASR
jgi:hypothetical protein